MVLVSLGCYLSGDGGSPRGSRSPGSTSRGPTTHVSSLKKEDLGRSTRGVAAQQLWCGEMEEQKILGLKKTTVDSL